MGRNVQGRIVHVRFVLILPDHVSPLHTAYYYKQPVSSYNFKTNFWHFQFLWVNIMNIYSRTFCCHICTYAGTEEIPKLFANYEIIEI